MMPCKSCAYGEGYEEPDMQAAFSRGKAEGKKETLDSLVSDAEDDFIVYSTLEWLKTMREKYLAERNDNEPHP